ncbi:MULTISPECIES: alpha/beta hydrolase [Kordiimonas]|jgi:pimeloyl-ACP methyl ester carboxylesterase|uniref:alpha/beta hydrolase n=1 Tax=Kordiimonas TaxID=288021 RepID=UPI00257B1ECC|nr:alpha/beta hydrolase [Kordiimonas sp. UBA4487]
MKKFITTAAAITFFLGAFYSPANASLIKESSEPTICDGSFLAESAEEALCRFAGSFLDVYLFKPDTATDTIKAPVLYLMGGPGSLVAPQRKRFTALAKSTGRVILVPAVADGLQQLDCHSDNAAEAVWGIAPDPDDAVIYGREQHAEKMARCFGQIQETLSSGVADTLGTDSIAIQLQRLRQDMGIGAWHLFAESYGARVALALAARDTAATLTQTLDSPETPWVEGFWHTGENFHAALKTLSGYCRDHFYCPGKRTRLERDLLKGIANQNAVTGEPVALKDIRTGQIDAYARPTREQLLISSFHALRSPARAAILPYIVASPDHMRERFGLLLDRLLYPGDGLNTGMHHLIRCRELPMQQMYRALEDDKLRHPDMAPFLSYLAWRQDYACRSLGVTPPARFDTPSLPDVPTLVLSGELDPVTPPDVVQAAFATKSKYAMRRYRSLGHVTHAQKACVLKDVISFWDAPKARMARTACGSDDLSLRFYSPVVVR